MNGAALTAIASERSKPRPNPIGSPDTASTILYWVVRRPIVDPWPTRYEYNPRKTAASE